MTMTMVPSTSCNFSSPYEACVDLLGKDISNEHIGHIKGLRILNEDGFYLIFYKIHFPVTSGCGIILLCL